MRRGPPVRTWTAPADLPPGDDLRKCFRSLLHRLELESGCTRAKIEESAKVRQRIQQERDAKPEPLRVYKNGSSKARPDTPERVPQRAQSAGRPQDRVKPQWGVSSSARQPSQQHPVSRRVGKSPLRTPRSPVYSAPGSAYRSPLPETRRLRVLEATIEDLQASLAVETGRRLSLESQLPIEVAATRAVKKSLEDAQKKLQAMETAVIRLTQEKDAFAHRMKALRTVNGQLEKTVEALKAQLADDEAHRLHAHRLTELQNKTVVMTMQQYVQHKVGDSQKQCLQLQARVGELEELCHSLGRERDTLLQFFDAQHHVPPPSEQRQEQEQHFPPPPPPAPPLSCNSPLPSSSSFVPQAFLRTQGQGLASLDSADDSRGPPPLFSDGEAGRPVKGVGSRPRSRSRQWEEQPSSRDPLARDSQQARQDGTTVYTPNWTPSDEGPYTFDPGAENEIWAPEEVRVQRQNSQEEDVEVQDAAMYYSIRGGEIQTTSISRRQVFTLPPQQREEDEDEMPS